MTGFSFIVLSVLLFLFSVYLGFQIGCWAGDQAVTSRDYWKMNIAAVAIGVMAIVALGVLTDSLDRTATQILEVGTADFTISQKHTDDIIVPDVRFDNEAEALRSLGGIIIEVRRGQAGLSGSAGAHVSESGLSLPADYVIENEGTLEELHEKFEAILFGDVAGAAQ